MRALATIVVMIGWGFCPDADATAQVNPADRYDAITRMFREVKDPAVPIVEAEPAWSLTLSIPPAAGGTMDAERIYVPLRDKLLVALDRESGRLVWSSAVDVALPPVVGDGRVFVHGANAISAFDGATGAQLWSMPIQSVLTAPLVWDNGWLLAPADSGDVLAFRAADGHLVWRRSLGATTAYPVVPGGRSAVYLVLSDGRVVALALATGDQLWERQLPGTLSQPAVGKDRVFIGSTDNFFYALHADTGVEQWKWRNGGDVIGAAVDGDVVFFASLDNIIRAVNRGNGNQRWRKPTGTRPNYPPSAFRGVVVVPGLMPAITVFVGETGDVMGTQAATGDLVGAPLVDPAPKPFHVALVTITREGVVEALRPASLMFREEKIAPVAALPGRTIAREQID